MAAGVDSFTHDHYVSRVKFRLVPTSRMIRTSICEVRSEGDMNKYYTLSKSDRPVTSWATDLDACDYDVKNNNTLWDSRLGAIGSRNLCKTCDNLIDQCIGHMGHITLATAIPHPFMRRRIAASASLICHECKQFVASPFSWIPLQVWENPAFVEETRNIDGFQAAVPAMSMILALMTKYFKNKNQAPPERR